MSVQEIETAIVQLPTPELAQLAAWFEEYHQQTVSRLGKTRLAQECAKLDPAEEQALADEGLAAEAAQWPPY